MFFQNPGVFQIEVKREALNYEEAPAITPYHVIGNPWDSFTVQAVPVFSPKPDPVEPSTMLHDEHELPFITTTILMHDLEVAEQRMSELGEPWLSEICKIARDHIRGISIEKRWLRVRCNWQGNQNFENSMEQK